MPVFNPVSNNKLYLQIYNQILDAIMQGTYRIGDKLPSEKELCQMFNVSRVPVREALCALELNGLVESNQGQGVYVRQAVPIPASITQWVQPHDIIQARKILEPDMARMAAEHIAEPERTEMAAIISQFRQELDRGEYSRETDRSFHQCIARATGNAILIIMADVIWRSMEQKMWNILLDRADTVREPEHRQSNLREHIQMGEAILRGDAESAYRLMQDHMDTTEEHYWG